MKYTNTYIHIRTLATLLAFASVILAPATASAQNATSQQSAAAGYSESSDKTNQTTELSDAQRAIPLEQKKIQSRVWGSSADQSQMALYKYAMSCKRWGGAYESAAMQAIKKYGTDQEKEMINTIWKDIKNIIKGIDASWSRIIKADNVLEKTAAISRSKGTEDTFAVYMQKTDDCVNLFNTESANIFKGGQTLAQYYQTTTEAIDRIVAKLREDPKTQADARQLSTYWKRWTPTILIKTTSPITMEPFKLDPTKTMVDPPAATTKSSTGKAGSKKAGKQKQGN